MDKVKDLDLYELLDISLEATDKEIKKAYRKKALSCHPDKNPDDKEAASRFYILSAALEVLTDESARKAYDNCLKARKAAALRNKALDAKRRKLKDDLERREKAHAENESLLDKKKQEDLLAAEIERLRKEGSKQLEREQELMRAELEEKNNVETNGSSSDIDGNKVKLKWKKADDERYSSEGLKKIFSKYDDVINVVVLTKNEKKSALIELKTSFGANNATMIERGFSDNPLKVKLLNDKSNSGDSSSAETVVNNSSNNICGTNNSKETDYETLVMRKLRQEQERKKLIQQMMEDDLKESS